MGNTSSSHSPQKFLEPTCPISIAGKENRLKNPPKHKEETATVATGCFWGPDHLVRKQFGGRGLISSTTGYIGGDTSNPTYRQVCTGKTGHAEAVKVVYDPSKVSYPEMIEFFMRTHDATDKGGQGGDRGTQYRSAIFVHNDEQKEIAEQLFKELTEAGRYDGKPIATTIERAGEWFNAEDYHQDYLEENPDGYHCPSHRAYW